MNTRKNNSNIGKICKGILATAILSGLVYFLTKDKKETYNGQVINRFLDNGYIVTGLDINTSGDITEVTVPDNAKISVNQDSSVITIQSDSLFYRIKPHTVSDRKGGYVDRYGRNTYGKDPFSDTRKGIIVLKSQNTLEGRIRNLF